jgi:RNA polymerase sigma-70 factor (ECF subfamily)
VNLSDPHVFAGVYRHHRRRVMTIAWRIVHDRELAEDLTQDVFAWLWSHPHAYDGRTSIGAYLGLAVRSRAIDERLRDEAVRAPARDPDDAVAALISSDEARELRALVAELSDAQRQALALTYWADLSIAAVAARVGLPEGTVKSRVRLARERLARSLRPAPA